MNENKRSWIQSPGLCCLAVALFCSLAEAQVDVSNDTCATAFGPVSDGIYSVDMTGATQSGVQPIGLPPFVSTLTPATACNDYGIPGIELHMSLDLWLEFTPALNRAYGFSTCNTATWNSKLAIYSGTCGNLIALACNDAGVVCQNQASQLLSPPLSAGTTYLIQIGSLNQLDPGGTASLLIADIHPPAPHDDCSGAIPISVGMHLGAIDTGGATASQVQAEPLPPYVDNLTPDTSCEPHQVVPGLESYLGTDLWFSFQPVVSGDYLFSTCGLSSFASKLAVFSGPCGSEVALACNDNGASCALVGTSELRVTNLVAGEEYFFVAGFGGSGATSDLLVALESTSPGSNYCQSAPNSYSASGALIAANGSLSVAANDLQLFARHIEPGQPCLFYYGPNQISTAFGDGQRCVGGSPGTVQRLFPFVVADAYGRLFLDVDNTNPVHAPQFQPGMTWNFQAWYRDPAAGASGFNLSDGLELTFAP